MAILPTPILSSIQTFDPSSVEVFQFYYSGNQIEKKRIVITNNETLEVVLDDTQLGMKLSYELAANILSVGQYTVQIQVFDFDGNSSELSQPALFYCFSTPHLSFVDFKNRVNKSSVDLKISYSQAENDSLKEFIYYLYDSNKNLIGQSTTFYSLDNSTYTFYGIKNITSYYVRCVGKTIHGMDADTGYCEFVADYIVQPNNMFIQVTNNRCEGYITVDCNIIDIGFSVDGNEPVFKDGEVILDDSKVSYISGYDFSDTFSMFVKARNVPLNKSFFGFTTSTGEVKLSIQKIATTYYCVLVAKSVWGNYCRYVELPDGILLDLTSNAVTDTDSNIAMVSLNYENDTPVIFEVKRKDNLYNLKVYYEEDGYVKA